MSNYLNTLYVVEMFPYPSGKLHVGHLRNYVFGDVLFRFKNMYKNTNVIHAIGWDAFGLPAENAAKAHNMNIKSWIDMCVENMKEELNFIHCHYDDTKEVNTSHMKYLCKTQNIFLQMLNAGIIYRGFSFVNWDPVDKTVLAKEQVINGKGWRSGAKVYQKLMSCYYFKLTKYAKRLYDGLNDTSWSGSLRKVQKNWLFKHNGYIVKMQIENTNDYIEIFTKHIDHLSACYCCILSYNHKLSIEFLVKNNIFFKHSDSQHMLLTNIVVINPVNDQKVKVYISDFVLEAFGTGAMYCSVYNDVDTTLLKHNNITFNINEYYISDHQYIYDILNQKGLISYSSCYGIHDWCISRQRVWGCPIPIAYCDNCGIIGIINEDINTQRLSFNSYTDLLHAKIHTKCNKCGNNARVETETLDTFFDSSWYYLNYICDDIQKALTKLPIDYYIGGIEHANLHLIYTRAYIMALSDIYNVKYTEPFAHIINQGIILHEVYMHNNTYISPNEYKKNKHTINYTVLAPSKMSKSKLNVICIEHLRQYCSSTLRTFILSNYPIEQTYIWDDTLLYSTDNFIKKIKIYFNNVIHTVSNTFSIDIHDKELKKIFDYGIQMYKQMKMNNVIASIHSCMKYYRSHHNNKDMSEWFNVMLVLIYPIMPEISNEYCYKKYMFYIQNAKILHT